MSTADQTRLTEDRARPRLMELWWALRPTTSVVRFLNSGAHPDDETTAMLAALCFGQGINLGYACSTRGEGGQNDIGTEAGADLGALRTREMERACDILKMRMYWLSDSPDDPITDFGFSKSGVETLGRWGAERTLAQFVEILRRDRPDILCPTFLDIPGQHGHHRAMTEMAHRAITAAADPAFPSNAAPWQVAKLYLPAWSGAGQAYDDDLPPPPATLTIDASGGDALSGWSWERIGQQSRAFHRTQGMGRWVPPGPGRTFPLHLAASPLPGPDDAITAGLPVTVADLADLPGIGAAAVPLRAAGAAIDAANAAFPDFAAVAAQAAAALTALDQASAACPTALHGDVLHRLAAKTDQLGHVLRLALGTEARAYPADQWLHAGDSTALTEELAAGDADAAQLSHDLPAGWAVTDGALTLAETATLNDPYRPAYDPLSPPAPALVLSLAAHGATTTVRLPHDTPPIALPARLATVTPDAALVNLAQPGRRIDLRLSDLRPHGGSVGLDLPPGWTAEETDAGLSLTLPQDVAEGAYTLPLTIDGAPAMTLRRIAYDHIDATARARPAALRVQVLTAEVPKGRIGYVGSGHDRVAHWLRALGAEVVALTDADLDSDTALAQCSAIVIGIFALRFRPGLAGRMPRLREWTQAGGTLLTLYHRPWDNWDPDTIPPRRLEIGQPSLRWRVTDEAAVVTHLADHPLLSTPNPIGPEDWDGWVKERGLYFAKSWDAAYQPLLEMADPDEAPLQGALLTADIGTGRHIHCALILHHQMEHLVPGAFRLIANLVARRG